MDDRYFMFDASLSTEFKVNSLNHLVGKIIQCRRCPRLRNHCEKISREKRRAFKKDDYWGKPVPGFGDPTARLLIVGLAPAAHGANRTGRMFTGDRSGEWLYKALWKVGWANQKMSKDRQDGLKLKNVFISAVVRCAPPANKPSRIEIHRCLNFLKKELKALDNIKVFLALGRIAYDGLWKALGEKNKKPKFKHGLLFEISNDRYVILSYHPSQQNTFTKRLTEPMFDSVFHKAQKLLTTNVSAKQKLQASRHY